MLSAVHTLNVILALAVTTGAGATVIYVDDDAAGPGTGLSWQDAFPNLQAALDAALADPNATEIRVAGGTYVPSLLTDPNDTRSATFLLGDGISLHGGYAGDPNEPELRDISLYETVLSGDLSGDGSVRVYNVLRTPGTSAQIYLDGLTVRDGLADGSGDPWDHLGNGGGLYIADDVVEIRRCRFLSNRAGYGGGGVYAYAGEWALIGCYFQGNRASYGGGVRNRADLTVLGCEFFENRALNVDHGAGGGLYNSALEGPVVVVANSVFVENFALEEGGGLVAAWGIDVTATNCTFVGNAAGTGGGVASMWPDTEVVLTNCILWGNEATGGGQQGAVLEEAALTISYSDVQGGGAGISATGGTLNWGPENIAVDPLFVSGSYPVYDLRLTHQSPCIDAGDCALLPLDSFDLDEDGDVSEQCPVDGDWQARRIEHPDVEDGGTCSYPAVDFGAFEASSERCFLVASRVYVPEGQLASTDVHLAWDPDAAITVTVTLEAGGDEDLTIYEGQTLEFDSGNFWVGQAITLAAAEDADHVLGEAVLRISAEGLPDTLFTAQEVENDVPSQLYVRATAPPAGDGGSWATAYADLEDALALARSSAMPTDIRIAGGTYVPSLLTDPNDTRSATFLLGDGISLHGGYAGDPNEPELRDISLYETVLSGDLSGDGSVRVYNVLRTPGTSAQIYLDGLTVRDGLADGSGDPWDHLGNGGGLYIADDVVEIRRCRFLSNRAGYGGGGVYAYAGEWALIGCYFQGNRASYGGGVRNRADLTVLGCEFFENRALNVDHGAGGGLYNSALEGPVVVVANSVFVENFALEEGGGLVAAWGIDVTATNCTFVGNAAGTGGGVASMWPDTEVVLTNCILWGNEATGGGQQGAVLEEAALTISYSDVQGGGAGISATGGTLNWGPENIAVDPLFVSGSYPVYDLRLTHQSPCIDAGLSAPDINAHAAGMQAAPGIDFDLHVRRVDDPNTPGGARTDPVVDLGAYEFGGTPIPTRVYVNRSATTSDTGVSWDSAFHDLQSAMMTGLAAAGDVHEVWVARGSYAPCTPGGDRATSFSLVRGVSIYGGFEGGESSLAECDPNLNETILTGDLNGDDILGDPNTTTDNSYHVVSASGVDGTALLDGFTITAGNANGGSLHNRGAGVLLYRSAPMLLRCVLDMNNADESGAAIYAERSLAILSGGTIRSNTAATGDGGMIAQSDLTLADWLILGGDPESETEELVLISSRLSGQVGLWLLPRARLRVVSSPWHDPTVIQTTVCGVGDIIIDPGQQLNLEDGAIIDLSGRDPNDPNGPCADPNSFADWGTIYVDGTLVCRDSTIRNTNVRVNAGDLADGTTIYNNEINLLQNPPGWGGEFFVEGTSIIECNVIRSEGDRYLDLDPDPALDPNDRPIIHDNRIYVTILQGVAGDQGELLELRAVDYDHDDPNLGAGQSGAYELSDSSGYADTWALERLEVWPAAKVNLTNRQGFVFQDPNGAVPEALYVRELKLHPDAVLNTGLQRVYYQELVGVDPDGVEMPLTRDPGDLAAPMENGSRIVDHPLLGYSLKVIEMEDDTEFDVRVRQRLRDPADSQPGQPGYGGNPSDPPLEGQVARSDDFADPNNGIMKMFTQAPGKQTALSVAAHGAFARAGDEDILVEFDYRFCGGADPNMVLLVYLSDAPEPRDPADENWSEHFLEIARVYPPPPGRPGAIGDPRFATFSGTFDRQHLNFTRGTYVELELRGGVDEYGHGLPACVEIDNWDPQIECTLTCLDLSGNNVVTGQDFLLHLAEAGATVVAGRGCLDAPFATNRYVDLDDVLALDTLLSADPPPGNYCEPPLPDPNLGSLVDPASWPAAGLLIAGKPVGNAGRTLQDDRLYGFDGESLATPLLPASAAPYHGNGRLIKGPGGVVYQLHATQGLVRLDTAAREIAPFSQDVNGQMVYVGVQPTGDIYGYTGDLGGYPQSLPLLDVAFDHDNPGVVYVVPVVVASTTYFPPPFDDEPYPYYKAAAQLTRQPEGSYQITQVYGLEPALDPCTNTVPPNASACQVQGQCEIELDSEGNVLVLSASGQSESNDWLVVYNATTGSEQVRIALTEMHPGLGNPTTLCASRHTPGRLYLSSELDPDPNDNQLLLYTCTLDPAQPTEPLVVTGETAVQCDGVLPGDYGYGHLLLATAVLESPDDGTVQVLGLSLARVAANLPQNDPLYQDLFCDTCPLAAQAWHAIVPANDGESTRGTGRDVVTATALTGQDLALPLSAVLLLRGDLTGDDRVNAADLAAFAGCMAGPGNPAACDDLTETRADADADNDIDLADLAQPQ